MKNLFKIILVSLIVVFSIGLFNFNRDGSKYNKRYIVTNYKTDVLYKQHYAFNVTIIKKLNIILNDVIKQDYTPESANEIPNIKDLDNYAKYDVFWIFTKKTKNNESFILVYITEGVEIINNKEFKIYIINKTEL